VCRNHLKSPLDEYRSFNAAVETFFKTIKAEMAIFEYINRFYNPRRRHSALGWKSPVAFERKVA
jgi:transposase InsO family protein